MPAPRLSLHDRVGAEATWVEDAEPFAHVVHGRYAVVRVCVAGEDVVGADADHFPEGVRRAVGVAGGASRAQAWARVSPLRGSNGRAGSKPALPGSGPGEGPRAIGVPKPFGTCGRAAGILSGSLPGRRKGLSARPVRRAGVCATPRPAPGTRGGTIRGTLPALGCRR